jgi:hypothetical protein
MADIKKPTVGKIEQLTATPSKNIIPFVPPAKVEFPNVPVQMTPEQFEQFERALIKGFVTMGYMANGGRPTSPSKIQELRDLIETVEEL